MRTGMPLLAPQRAPLPPPPWAVPVAVEAVPGPVVAWRPGRVAAKTSSITVECDGESWDSIANYRKRLTTFSYYVSDYYLTHTHITHKTTQQQRKQSQKGKTKKKNKEKLLEKHKKKKNTKQTKEILNKCLKHTKQKNQTAIAKYRLTYKA